MSSKKGKKSKDKKVSLQEFLATNGTNSGTTQVVVQKVSSWADECDDDDDRPTRHEVIELPTAPRSTRILEDDSIPHEGPFIARVANLPFDTNEDEIIEFFANRDIQVKEMRLARDDNNDKLRGFGQIEFDCREDLINAIMIHDAMIQNRRIRIEVASESDGRDGRTVRRRFDYSGGGNNESTNWREKKDYGFETVSDNRRDGRDNRRGGDYQRSSFQNRHDNNNNNNDEMSNWRMGERQVDSPPPERRRAGGGERGGFDRNDRRRDGGGRDRYERKPPMDEERPVLKLQPRTKPLPVLVFPKEEETVKAERKPSSLNGDAENHDDSADEKEKVEKPAAPKPKPIPNAVVFGDAKPVDTAAREREIEAKLDQERQARNDANRNEREMSRNVEQTEVKKDIIVIKTEKTRLQEEANNWRKYDESSEPPRNRDNRDNRDNGRRLTDRRNDDRGRDDRGRDNRYKENRNFNNNNRVNDYHGNRRGGDRRDGPRRDGNDFRREETKEVRRERQIYTKEPEERMPKLKVSTGPNLDISNAYAGLDVEVDIE